MAIHSIGIISKPRKEELAVLLPELLAWLKHRGIQALIDRETASSLDAAARSAIDVPILERSELPQRSDLILVLGGDGTLLAAARNVESHNVPILAVNLGSLGFLTAVTVGELYDSLELVLDGKHQIDCRKMLQVQVIRAGNVAGTYQALNDAVLNKAAIARILDFEAYVDGRFLTLFKADGVIISTPTGSTAYSLAAGGPIIYPSVEAFIVTPICPHTLTNRPVVVPDRSRIEIVIKGEAESVFLTVDGQVGLSLHHEDRIVCDLSPSRINLVRPPHKEFFEVLRSKLKWGER
ncbi:MAG: NAD(+) kinase [Acidobacteria bacterium RIFCSPLOWO2_12_FULL_60_22]|nr:MAG: NAD(+) kinase [Acidobacteria bacterium RIFCSPLOWO2_12_FULL_60_22]